MILVKTPLRISFMGGYTDFPDFYNQYQGRVLSTTIDKYVYIAISKKFNGDIRLSYSLTENVASSAEIKHNRVRAGLQKLGIEKGIEIVSIADLPSEGIGLGSSSAFTVGLLNGLHTFLGEDSNPQEIAQEASEIEVDILDESMGRQDQYAVAHGGLNIINFSKDGITVAPVQLDDIIKQKFQEHLMFFYTAKTRQGKSILHNGRANIESNFEILKKMSDSAPLFYTMLKEGNYEGLGNLLHEMWMLKKGLADGISNSEIDEMYELARANGAWGGKICGAGGGGFLMLMVEPSKQQAVREAISWQEIKIQFSDKGSEIVYQSI